MTVQTPAFNSVSKICISTLTITVCKLTFFLSLDEAPAQTNSPPNQTSNSRPRPRDSKRRSQYRRCREARADREPCPARDCAPDAIARDGPTYPGAEGEPERETDV